VIPIRVTKAQWRELQKRAKEQGIPVSQYIRKKLELSEGTE
jgi:predicted DNA binding CopG/RHH family protein